MGLPNCPGIQITIIIYFLVHCNIPSWLIMDLDRPLLRPRVCMGSPHICIQSVSVWGCRSLMSAKSSLVSPTVPDLQLPGCPENTVVVTPLTAQQCWTSVFCWFPIRPPVRCKQGAPVLCIYTSDSYKRLHRGEHKLHWCCFYSPRLSDHSV